VKQKSIFHSANLNYFGIKNHKIDINYYISKTRTYDVVSKLTNRDTGDGLTDYTDTIPFFDINALRNTTILTIEDKYDYSDKLQFLSSISYENNTHIDPKINPKLSLVYRRKNNDIFKLLYSSSHRTPSWQELYTLNNHSRVGNTNLKAEKIQTFESSYIKHLKHNSFIQSTLFCLKNKNQIHNNTKNHQYTNSKKTNTLQGLEFEYKGYITPKDTLYINMSYIDGENSYDQSLSLVSKFLLKGYYIYNLQDNISISTVVKYGSKRHRLKYDPRKNRAGNAIIDTAVNYKNHKYNYKLSLSIKNILDKDTYYSSKPHTYEDDYPQIGRNFILSFSKEF
jgi:iron complex outermembrane receptor protein